MYFILIIVSIVPVLTHSTQSSFYFCLSSLSTYFYTYGHFSKIVQRARHIRTYMVSAFLYTHLDVYPSLFGIRYLRSVRYSVNRLIRIGKFLNDFLNPRESLSIHSLLQSWDI